MDRRLFLSLIAAFPSAAWARRQVVSVDELIGAGERLLQENVDPQWLEALPSIDQKRVADFLERFQLGLQGDQVIDLAPLKPLAASALPLLRAHPDTQPYAQWLETRLDYLDVAEQFLTSLRPPAPQPGKPPKPALNPTPVQQQRVWDQQISKEPQSREATELVPRLRKIFQKEGVPTALVWVAEVESSFKSGAKSPAGAVGLYQLMPQTARTMGLSLFPRDQRLDPEKNAAAAARYLKSLYPKFREWRLTMAAYNWGPGNVRRLLEKRRSKTFDSIAVHLPAETQMYVPKVDAVLRRRERTALAQLPPPAR